MNYLDSPIAIAQDLGERLKQARLNLNWTQQALSKKSGVSVKLIQSAEQGKVQLINLIALLQAMDLTTHLDKFLPPQPISPLQLAKLHGKRRVRASREQVTKETDELAW